MPHLLLRRYRKALINTVGLLIGVIFLLPIIWMLITAISPVSSMGKFPPALFPAHPTGSNFVNAFSAYDFESFLRSSGIVCAIATGLVICLGSVAAYALARTKMRGRFGILVALLVVSTFPSLSVVTPLYTIYRVVGILNTYQALIIPYTALNLPFAIWLMRNYFVRIPFELEESGQVDGASWFTIIVRLILPQALPGMFVAATLTFAACWQEFFMCLVFNTLSGHQTVPVGISLMTSYSGVPYPTVFAACIVALVPITVLVLLMRKWIIGGGIQGAVKG
ncbi:MAG: carbohydrate ABC transporter permease [Acidimicrobiales bacterium]